MIEFTLADGRPFRNAEQQFIICGLLPWFFDDRNPRSAVEQIHNNYLHGGGWHDYNGFEVAKDRMALCYNGDPPMLAKAKAMLRDELIVLYQSNWVAVYQPDGTHRIARID